MGKEEIEEFKILEKCTAQYTGRTDEVVHFIDKNNLDNFVIMTDPSGYELAVWTVYYEEK